MVKNICMYKKVDVYIEEQLNWRRLEAIKEKAERDQLQKQREKEIRLPEAKAYQISHESLPPITTSPEKPPKQPVSEEPAPKYEVHVSESNYIVPSMVGFITTHSIHNILMSYCRLFVGDSTRSVRQTSCFTFHYTPSLITQQ